MAISKIPGYAGQQVGKPQETEASRVDPGKTGQGKDTAPSRGSDRVEFSTQYQTINNVKKVAMSHDDIRTELVDHLRTMVENNTYNVNPTKVADKMLDELR
jgi:flagellar biosynthesis anti-sigma factor FlgM